MASFKTLTCSMLAALTVALTSTAAPRSVDYPWINYSNTYLYDITKVELTDSGTVLSMHAYLLPGRSLTIDSDITVRAQGKKYALIGAEGITPGSAFMMDEKGEAQFKLIFEPLPADISEFDVIENDIDVDALRMWSVDLDHKEYKSLFPKEFLGDIKSDGEIPAPVFEIGKSTVNLHFVPFRADLPPIDFVIRDISGQQYPHRVELDSNGEGSITFDQYGTVEALIHPKKSGIAAEITIQPGETIDCYIDPRMTGYQAMMHRDGMTSELYKTISHNGVYSDFDRERDNRVLKYRLSAHKDGFADSTMTIEAYKQKIKNRYDVLRDSIMNSDGSRMFKEYQMLLLQDEVMNAVSSDFIHPSIFKREIYMSDEDYAEATKWFDMSNPKLMLPWGSHISFFDWNEHGVPGDLSKSLDLFREMSQRLKFGDYNEARRNQLKALSNPFFLEAIDSMNQRYNREYDKLVAEDVSNPAPDVPGNEVLEAIAAQHPGKVVVVYMWHIPSFYDDNIQMAEPIISRSSGDDVVWINLTRKYAYQNKPDISYFQKKKTLLNPCYELSEKQINELLEKYGLDHFIRLLFVVDREGNVTNYKEMHNMKGLADLVKSKL